MNDKIWRTINNYKTIIIYGIGVFGRRCYFDLKDFGQTIKIAVTQTNNKNQHFHGIKVQNLDELLQYKDEAIVIIAVGEKYRDEMETYAKQLGFRNVYSPVIKLHDYNYIKEHPDIDLKKEIADWYEVYTGEIVEIDDPRTFNEKIQWL
ncbi:MAG: hypothetical protein HFH94_18165, partial [Lachnospiraceae bacterium]|nr:hypothetical protein [Lachnospiraceae bacterium]